jgi:cell wall-associated NlpC family hydrolase
VIRASLVAVALLLVVPVLGLAAANGGIQLSTPSGQAVAGIPPSYLLLYQQAGLAFDVPWEVLAGIGKVECDHGQSPDPACWQEGKTNSAGASGPMQFLASTWAQYGLDGDNDGRADRWDPADAIVSAANFLKQNGAPDNIPAAIYAYNHSAAYVNEVEQWASTYANSVQDTPTPASSGGGSAVAATAVQYALAQLGTPYRWGGDEPGGFDCSGLVQAAYRTAGMELPRTAQQQYGAGPLLSPGTPLEPGDLVFFGSDTSHVEHVGIVASAGVMVDAPHTGAVVRTEPYDWPDYLGATRPSA